MPLTEVDAGGPEHESYDAPSPYRASVGHVPNSGDAALPTLTMTGTATSAPADSNGQPSVDGVHVPAAAMLLEPSGDPIAGASIHLTLQRWLGEYWQIHQEVDAVTDHDGVARARVPARGTAAYPNGAWRITATYDGVPGELYARHASSALTITP